MQRLETKPFETAKADWKGVKIVQECNRHKNRVKNALGWMLMPPILKGGMLMFHAEGRDVDVGQFF